MLNRLVVLILSALTFSAALAFLAIDESLQARMIDGGCYWQPAETAFEFKVVASEAEFTVSANAPDAIMNSCQLIGDDLVVTEIDLGSAGTSEMVNRIQFMVFSRLQRNLVFDMEIHHLVGGNEEYPKKDITWKLDATSVTFLEDRSKEVFRYQSPDPTK